MIWVNYLGMGWRTGDWIKTRFMHHKLGTLYAYTYAESVGFGRLSWDGVANRSKTEFFAS